jgi:hypothetical protein
MPCRNPDELEVLYQAYAGGPEITPGKGSSLAIWIGLMAQPRRGPTRAKSEWMWASTGETPTYDGWS